MEELSVTADNLSSALDRLCESLDYLKKLESIKNEEQASILMSNQELERSLRDSLIQRFEICSDLFWKYLKRYEEEVLKLKLEMASPRSVILMACKAKIISESDSELLLDLINSRNFTSHIYREEIADIISGKIVGYYKVMREYTNKLVNEQ